MVEAIGYVLAPNLSDAEQGNGLATMAGVEVDIAVGREQQRRSGISLLTELQAAWFRLRRSKARRVDRANSHEDDRRQISEEQN